MSEIDQLFRDDRLPVPSRIQIKGQLAARRCVAVYSVVMRRSLDHHAVRYTFVRCAAMRIVCCATWHTAKLRSQNFKPDLGAELRAGRQVVVWESFGRMICWPERFSYLSPEEKEFFLLQDGGWMGGEPFPR